VITEEEATPPAKKRRTRADDKAAKQKEVTTWTEFIWFSLPLITCQTNNSKLKLLLKLFSDTSS